MTKDTCPHHIRMQLSWLLLCILSATIAWLTPAALRKARKQETADRTARVLEKLDIALVVVDREMKITHFSRGAEKLLNCSAEEVVGESMIWMLPQDLRAAHTKAMAAWWKTDDYSRRVMECIGQDFHGNPIPMQITIDPIKLDAGWEISVFVEPQRPVVRAETPSHVPSQIRGPG